MNVPEKIWNRIFLWIEIFKKEEGISITPESALVGLTGYGLLQLKNVSTEESGQLILKELGVNEIEKEEVGISEATQEVIDSYQEWAFDHRSPISQECALENIVLYAERKWREEGEKDV